MKSIRDRIKEFRRVPATELIPNAKNWRRHPNSQQKAMRAVLEEIGFAGAVLAREDESGNLVLIDGHLRAGTATESEIPVLVLDVTEAEADKILATYDPLSSMAEIDSTAWSKLIDGIDFQAAEFGELLADLNPRRISVGLTDEDAIPDPPAPITKSGDLWQLGQHRLLCGDATSAADVNRLLDGAEPILMVTDPPYGIRLDMEWRDKAGLNIHGPSEPSYMRRSEKYQNQSMSSDTRADWSDAFALADSLEVAYVWHASSFTREVLNGLLRIGFIHSQQIIWNKGTATRTRTHYWFQHEPCWYVRKKNAPWFGRGGTADSTIWDAIPPKFIFGGSTEEKVDHPTQKPVVLFEKAILNHLRPRQIVYEPFSGSGTNLIASEKTGRICLAIEIEPRYVDVAVKRWEDFTGMKAVRNAGPQA